LSEADSIAATLRKEEIAFDTACLELLKPFGIPLTVAVEGLAHALEKTGSISHIHEAVDAWTENHRELERNPSSPSWPDTWSGSRTKGLRRGTWETCGLAWSDLV
jgi:hypothetical protein